MNANPNDQLRQLLTFYVETLRWWIIPCGQLDKRPTREHKHWDRPPSVELLLLFRDAYLRRSGGLEPNWSVRCDKSGLIVFDVDQHAADADGVVSLAKI